MATYLTLCNEALKETNEVTISTVSGNRGLQAFVVDAVNRAIQDINKACMEWPFNKASTTQDLTQGISEYSITSGYSSVDPESFILKPKDLITNGAFTGAITSWTDISTGTGAASASSNKLRLNAGASGVAAATQAISTIGNKPHKIKFQTFSGDITLKIGTTSGGTEILSQSCTLDYPGAGTYHVVSFTPTTASTYVTFSHTTNDNYDVDNVEAYRDVSPTPLNHVQYDEYRKITKYLDLLADKTRMGTPSSVTLTQQDTFIIADIPEFSDMQVVYDYWTVPSEMDSDDDTPAIPTRYQDVIICRVCEYIHNFKSDATRASKYEAKFKDGISEMRRELINKNDYVRAT